MQIDLNGLIYIFKYQTEGGLHLTSSGGTCLMLGPDIDATRLTTRGFHWINEMPYNR